MEIELKSGILEVIGDKELFDEVQFTSRINRKRGFLFLSKSLGKHLQTDPFIMEKSYKKLSSLIKNDLIGEDRFTLIIGFAETATALGWGVFDSLNLSNSLYIHTTRYHFHKEKLLTFYEEHSHSPSHILYKPDIELSRVTDILLVDDEISTGKTAQNLKRELEKIFGDINYHLISILHWNRESQKEEINSSALFYGEFKFFQKREFLEKQIELPVSEALEKREFGSIAPFNFGRFGKRDSSFSISREIDFEDLKEQRVLVIGTGEFMYQPYLFAKKLRESGIETNFLATTRSPIAVDGAITSSIEFKDNYFEGVDNFLYNIEDESYQLIYLCYEVVQVPEEFTLKRELENRGFKVEEIFFREL